MKKLEPLENMDKILRAAVGTEQVYLAVINDTYWDFWDPKCQLYLTCILENQADMVQVFPMNDDFDMFEVYKFRVSLN